MKPLKYYGNGLLRLFQGPDRNNHLYFYEKVEEAIEAAFVIKKRMHKRRFRKQKRKK